MNSEDFMSACGRNHRSWCHSQRDSAARMAFGLKKRKSRLHCISLSNLLATLWLGHNLAYADKRSQRLFWPRLESEQQTSQKLPDSRAIKIRPFWGSNDAQGAALNCTLVCYAKEVMSLPSWWLLQVCADGDWVWVEGVWNWPSLAGERGRLATKELEWCEGVSGALFPWRSSTNSKTTKTYGNKTISTCLSHDWAWLALATLCSMHALWFPFGG